MKVCFLVCVQTDSCEDLVAADFSQLCSTFRLMFRRRERLPRRPAAARHTAAVASFQFASLRRWHTHGWAHSRHMEAKIAQEAAAQTHRDAGLLRSREIPHQLRNVETKISVSINSAPTVNGEITAGESSVNQASLACRWGLQGGCQYLFSGWFVMLCCNPEESTQEKGPTAWRSKHRLYIRFRSNVASKENSDRIGSSSTWEHFTPRNEFVSTAHCQPKLRLPPQPDHLTVDDGCAQKQETLELPERQHLEIQLSMNYRVLSDTNCTSSIVKMLSEAHFLQSIKTSFRLKNWFLLTESEDRSWTNFDWLWSYLRYCFSFQPGHHLFLSVPFIPVKRGWENLFYN